MDVGVYLDFDENSLQVLFEFIDASKRLNIDKKYPEHLTVEIKIFINNGLVNLKLVISDTEIFNVKSINEFNFPDLEQTFALI